MILKPSGSVQHDRSKRKRLGIAVAYNLNIWRSFLMHTREDHRTDRIGWLRAAVMGANDGIVSVASLIIGVVAAGSDSRTVLVAGLAGLVAGAMSMAAGEYVSVWSQADTEAADRELERRELRENPEHELAELTQIYIERGVSPCLARQVAVELTAHDALGSHLRDELGLSETHTARPFQAAWTSALTFALGASLPVLASCAGFNIAWGAYPAIATVAATSLFALVLLGALAAKTGGAAMARGAIRVAGWGALAMALTCLVGLWIGGPAG